MRFATRVLALAAALVVPAGAAPDPLAAIAGASGHPAALHLRIAKSGTYEGRRFVETLDRQGTAFLLRRCIADACSGTWFDGTRGWEFGLNEVTLPLDDGRDGLRRTLAAIVSLAFAEPAFHAAGGSVEPAGRETWRVRAAGGEPLVAEFDPATLALRAIRDAQGAEVGTFGRIAHAGGAAIPLEQRVLDGGSFQTADVVAEKLQPPAGATATFAGSPIAALDADAVPIVRCTFGGRTARCLLDTGATPSAITLPFAEALQLEPHGELEISAFSRFATGFVESGPLDVGSARFAGARFAVIPALAAAHFDVVIGADLLARVRVVFDRARRQVEILAPGGATPPGAIPLRFAGGVPRLAATLDGVPADALFDSGDAAIVSLGYAEYRRGPQWPVVARSQAVGIAGAGDAFVVAIPEVAIGAVSLGATRAAVARTQNGVHVGIGLWSRCPIVLDEARETLSCIVR